MNCESFQLVWRVVSSVLLGNVRLVQSEILDSVYYGEAELPEAIERLLVQFAASLDMEDFSSLAIEIVRGFHVARFDPSAHFVILGYLVAKRRIDLREAVQLAQISRENFLPSQQDGIELSRKAERVDEEEKMGFMSVRDDSFFESALAMYCRAHGFDFEQSSERTGAQGQV